MSKLKITKANRLTPNLLKINVNGLEVDFDNCSFTHNSVVLKVKNNIKARLVWIDDNQESKFIEEINKFKVTDSGFDIIVEKQIFNEKESA